MMKNKMQVSLWLCAVICSSLADDLEASTTTALPSANPPKATINPEVPLEFPSHSQNYTFVDNASIRETLVSHARNDTEVGDLLGKDVSKEVSSQSPPLLNIPPNPSEEEEDIRGKNETEWIEDGSDTEDNKFTSTVASEKKHDAPLFEGHVAVIAALSFLVVAIVAYTALLMWRRFLEAKYGSREMLVNEDEFVDPDDLKHFSI